MSYFSFFLNCSKGGGATLFIYFDFFTIEEEGAEVKVFFFSFIRHVQRGGEGALVQGEGPSVI